MRPQEPKPHWSNRIFAPFPDLDREQRIELLERVRLGASGDIDYVVMMAISAGLAALGLLQGSAAVVIGAMLVAPLMGPLVAAGLALAQGNLTLFRGAVRVTLMGVGLGLGVSLLAGAVNPGFEPSVEIESRGNPDLLDMGIALLSGMAAAWAMGRPNVAITLAGVAIAAALVPPLAVVGVAATSGAPRIAIAASVLLGTNLVAIVLGAALVFRALGVHATLGAGKLPVWAQRATMLLCLAAVLLAAPLGLNAIEQSREGQRRALTYPVAPVVREAIAAYLGAVPGVDLLAAGRNSVEPQAGILVLLISERPVPPAFEDGLRAVVREARGDPDIPVRISPVRSARALGPSPPEPARP
jgi:uncharacterized hydrophobic protein (TIGR00271 family)